MSRVQRVAYIAFLTAAAIWLGAGVYHTVLTSATWYDDPTWYVRNAPEQQLPGAVNPFPLIAAVATPALVVALVLLARWRGPGRSLILTSLLTTGGLILVTAAYFVPALLRLLDPASTLSPEAIESLSHRWIALNVVRVLVLAAAVVAGLVGLARSGSAPPSRAVGTVGPATAG